MVQGQVRDKVFLVTRLTLYRVWVAMQAFSGGSVAEIWLPRHFYLIISCEQI